MVRAFLVCAHVCAGDFLLLQDYWCPNLSNGRTLLRRPWQTGEERSLAMLTIAGCANETHHNVFHRICPNKCDMFGAEHYIACYRCSSCRHCVASRSHQRVLRVREQQWRFEPVLWEWSALRLNLVPFTGCTTGEPRCVQVWERITFKCWKTSALCLLQWPLGQLNSPAANLCLHLCVYSHKDMFLSAQVFACVHMCGVCEFGVCVYVCVCVCVCVYSCYSRNLLSCLAPAQNKPWETNLDSVQKSLTSIALSINTDILLCLLQCGLQLSRIVNGLASNIRPRLHYTQ